MRRSQAQGIGEQTTPHEGGSGLFGQWRGWVGKDYWHALLQIVSVIRNTIQLKMSESLTIYSAGIVVRTKLLSNIAGSSEK